MKISRNLLKFSKSGDQLPFNKIFLSRKSSNLIVVDKDIYSKSDKNISSISDVELTDYIINYIRRGLSAG